MKKKIGQDGEEQALSFLEGKGYMILTRNFRSRFGEIDIIAYEKKTNYTVFVEVKTRTNLAVGRAEESITATKKQRMLKTAMYYLAIHPTEYIRFDLVAINLFEENAIMHLENIIEA